jgi:hypothetical protein
MLRGENINDYRKQEYINRISNMILEDTRRDVMDLVIENDKVKLLVKRNGTNEIREMFIDENGNVNCYEP